jgi:hypothetical protein
LTTWRTLFIARRTFNLTSTTAYTRLSQGKRIPYKLFLAMIFYLSLWLTRSPFKVLSTLMLTEFDGEEAIAIMKRPLEET